jgi:hypothetical protein
MHFIKAFTLLATVASAAVAVALPAADTKAMFVKRQATNLTSLPDILNSMNGTLATLRANIGG